MSVLRPGEVQPSALGRGFLGTAAGAGTRLLALTIDVLTAALLGAGVYLALHSVVLTSLAVVEFGAAMVILEARTGLTVGNGLVRTRTSRVDKPFSPGIGRSAIRGSLLTAGFVALVAGAWVVVGVSRRDAKGRRRALIDSLSGTVAVAMPARTDPKATAANGAAALTASPPGDPAALQQAPSVDPAAQYQVPAQYQAGQYQAAQGQVAQYQAAQYQAAQYQAAQHQAATPDPASGQLPPPNPAWLYQPPNPVMPGPGAPGPVPPLPVMPVPVGPPPGPYAPQGMPPGYPPPWPGPVPGVAPAPGPAVAPGHDAQLPGPGALPWPGPVPGVGPAPAVPSAGDPGPSYGQPAPSQPAMQPAAQAPASPPQHAASAPQQAQPTRQPAAPAPHPAAPPVALPPVPAQVEEAVPPAHGQAQVEESVPPAYGAEVEAPASLPPARAQAEESVPPVRAQAEESVPPVHAQVEEPVPPVRAQAEESVPPAPGPAEEPASSPQAMITEPLATVIVLTFDTGQRIDLPVPSVVNLGRAPSAMAPGDMVVPVDDPNAMVSKTHARIECDVSGVWITDLNSTNGTGLLGPDGDFRPLPPRNRVGLRHGDQVRMSRRVFAIDTQSGGVAG